MTEVNKVIYDGNVLVDLTSDTVTADDVMAGQTFHLASGEQGVGALSNTKLGIGYGSCLTSSGTNLAVSCTDFSLAEGGLLAVTFVNDVPASSYLNVNGTGNKIIGYKAVSSAPDFFYHIPAGVINAGDTALFMYHRSTYLLLSICKTTTLILDSELTSLETTLGL